MFYKKKNKEITQIAKPLAASLRIILEISNMIDHKWIYCAIMRLINIFLKQRTQSSRVYVCTVVWLAGYHAPYPIIMEGHVFIFELKSRVEYVESIFEVMRSKLFQCTSVLHCKIYSKLYRLKLPNNLNILLRNAITSNLNIICSRVFFFCFILNLILNLLDRLKSKKLF